MGIAQPIFRPFERNVFGGKPPDSESDNDYEQYEESKHEEPSDNLGPFHRQLDQHTILSGVNNTLQVQDCSENHFTLNEDTVDK